jgi:hypothetical protein
MKYKKFVLSKFTSDSVKKLLKYKVDLMGVQVR